MKKMLLTFFLNPVIATAQKPFSLVIHLPENIQKEKLEVTLHNGKGRKYYGAKNGLAIAQTVVILPAGEPFQAG